MHERAALYGWLLAITFGSLVLAFVIRWALKLVFRAERMPRAEALVDQWWVWAPMVAVLAVVWWYAGLLLGLLFAAVAMALMRYWGTLFPSLRRRRYPDV